MRIFACVVVGLVSTAAVASPITSPPNAATSASLSVDAPLAPDLHLKENAPNAIKKLFARLLWRRDIERGQARSELNAARALLSGYENAKIVPSLKPIESPWKSPAGFWAFKTRKMRDNAVESQRGRVDSISAQVAKLETPGYLPWVGAVSSGTFSARAKAKYYTRNRPDDVHPNQLYDLNLTLPGDWIGRLSKAKVVRSGAGFVVVEPIVSVEVELVYAGPDYSGVIVGRSPSMTGFAPDQPIRPIVLELPSDAVFVQVPRDSVISVEDVIDLSDRDFVIDRSNDRAELIEASIENWLEPVPTTQPSN